MDKLLLFFLILSLTITPLNPVFANDNSASTQTNTSGSNTSISGGYTSETTNTYDGGQTNTTTTTSTNSSSTNQKTIPVGNASAPSMSSYSQDLCTVGVSFGVQTLGLGVAGGTYFTDQNCERMKLSKLLYDYQMRVAAVAILCQDDRVFSAMEHAGTPCPFEGKIGQDAKNQWKKYDIERPDYDRYTDKLKKREYINQKLSKEAQAKIDAIKRAEQEKAERETKRKMKELMKLKEEVETKKQDNQSSDKKEKGKSWFKFDFKFEHMEVKPADLSGHQSVGGVELPHNTD
jgi:hypothetical protein|tara:strand:+ start:68 stop:937 length:870 start_codon:yes stop_codon:yes gene_type:complete